MADDNLNQNDIEQLLSGKGAGGEKDTLGQNEIESLLSAADGAKNAGAKSPPPAAPAPPPPITDIGMDDILGQNEIENLLKGAAMQKPASASASFTPGTPPPPPVQEAQSKPSKNLFPEDGSVNEADVEYLLNQAEQAINSIRNGTGPDKLPSGVRQFNFERFGGTVASTEMATLDLVKDVDLDLRIELGRTHMYLQDVLKLRSGSVVPLDKLAGDPVDIFVNGRLIAKGEVLVLNDNFCVRIGELIAGAEAG